MNINMILQMLNTFGWIKDKLTQLWVDPKELQNVNFNDPNSLNNLAQKIMPGLLKSNPWAAAKIKEMAGQVAPDKVNDIVQIIW